MTNKAQLISVGLLTVTHEECSPKGKVEPGALRVLSGCSLSPVKLFPDFNADSTDF